MSSENKYAAPPNLQEAIDKAGSPMKLVWKPTAPAWTVPVVKPEYVGWSQEQKAWRETAALSDLSHHMFDLFMEVSWGVMGFYSYPGARHDFSVFHGH